MPVNHEQHGLTQRKGRVEQLDSLRGLAALSVVLCHWLKVWLPVSAPGRQSMVFRAALSRHDPQILTQLGFTTLLSMSPLRVFFAGSEAVVLFFVLSGFVLSLPLWNDDKTSYSIYIVKRIFRIYVPYLAALAFAAAGDSLLSTGGIPTLNQWFNSTWHKPIDLGAIWGNVLLIGSYRDNEFNTAFWSLVHEMRISLIFPPVISLVKKIGDRAALLPLPTILAGTALAAILPTARIFESVQVLGFFLAGACLARARFQVTEAYRSWGAARRGWFFIASLGLYSFGWLWIFPGQLLGWPVGYQNVFVCAGALGLIVTAIDSDFASRFLLRDYPVALGRASYSLYLLHATVLWGLIYVLYSLVRPAAIFGLYLAILFPVTFCFWKFVEDPSNRLGRRLGQRMAKRGHPASVGAAN